MAERPLRKSRKSWYEDVRVTDDISTIKVKMLLKGGPGVGKTSLMGTAPRPFIIDAESGLLTLFKLKVPFYPLGKKAQGKYYDTTMAILDAIENDEKVGDLDFSQIDTICLDSVSKLNELLKADIDNKAGEHPNSMQDWGTLNKQISAIMNRFVQLDKHVIVSVGEATKLDEDEVLYHTLNIRGSYRDFIEHEFDFVLWMQKETTRAGTKYFTTGENMQGRSGKMRGITLEKKMENPSFGLIDAEIKKQLCGKDVPIDVVKKVDLALDIEM